MKSPAEYREQAGRLRIYARGVISELPLDAAESLETIATALSADGGLEELLARHERDGGSTALAVRQQCAELIAFARQQQVRINRLTGMKFSDRMHAALVSRTVAAETIAQQERERAEEAIRLLRVLMEVPQHQLDYAQRLSTAWKAVRDFLERQPT